MANLTSIGSWSALDVQHFARRAGFGLSPEAAAAATTSNPSTFINAWVDGGQSSTLFDTVYVNRSDVVAINAIDPTSGNAANMLVPAVTSAHGFLCDGANTWRNRLSVAQAAWAFQMQYAPDSFRERLALFWHQFFATGYNKVQNTALMLEQIQLFRDQGLGNFTDLLVAVSKNPAMCVWLDSVSNSAVGSAVPNENYSREVLELYSLGVDNGYSQQDITSLAKALSGWSFYVAPSDIVSAPNNIADKYARRGTVVVSQGQTVPTGSLAWYMGALGNSRLPNQHPTSAANATGGTATITFLGRTFDYTVAQGGMVPGEDVLRSITTSRATQCSEYLAARIISHFVTPNFTSQDVQDFGLVIRNNNFNIGTALKVLFKSQFFFDAAHRFALITSPIVWLVSSCRMLGYNLSEGDALSIKGFPAWRLLVGASEFDSSTFDNLGLALLDPAGPNGWGEHDFWVNANMMRYRSYCASAVALNETYRYTLYQGSGASSTQITVTLAPTDLNKWFPTTPPTSLDVFNRLSNLLQLAPMPTSLRDAWLNTLFGGNSFAISLSNTTHQTKIRELAFMMMSTPAHQLH
jgi:hypothetical protein